MFLARLISSSALVFWVLPVLVFAQPDESTFRVEVRLVQIEVRVSRDGRPLSNLKKDDFILKEDGDPQSIRFFKYIAGPEDTKTVSNQGGGTGNAAGSEKGSPSRSGLTWIYIAPEVSNPKEFNQTAKGIRRFILKQMKPGFLVSLGGLPFSDDRELLLTTLDRMQSAPYGGDQTLPAVSTELFRLTDLQYQRHVAKALKDEAEWLTTISGVDREGDFKGPLDRLPPLAAETVDRQIVFLGELALLRYLDLVEQMAFYPGKKVIVLFRSGFSLPADNHPLIARVAAAAGRNRVSFYTMDSRGLATIQPIEDRKYSLAWDTGREHNYYPKILRQAERDRKSREGLEVLARKTNGRALADTNDLGAVLTRVADDATDYYILGYYPTNLTERGRFRKLDISLAVPRARVDAPRGYYEEKPFRQQSRKEKTFSLRRALESEGSNFLPLKGEVDLFATSEGQALAIFSLGISLKDAKFKSGKDKVSVSADILARISDKVSHKLPVYQQGNIRHSLTRKQLMAAREDPTLFLTYNSQCAVSTGLYQWRAVFRDAKSGNFGVVSARLEVPDFSQPSTPSSILLTRHVANSRDFENSNPVAEILTANGQVYLPQPAHLFTQGDTIHMIFHLYHPSEADIDAATRGMQLGLIREGKPVANVEAFGEPIIDHQADVIRYTASLTTRQLEPGQYTLLAILPNYATRGIPHLEDHFTLLPRHD